MESDPNAKSPPMSSDEIKEVVRRGGSGSDDWFDRLLDRLPMSFGWKMALLAGGALLLFMVAREMSMNDDAEDAERDAAAYAALVEAIEDVENRGACRPDLKFERMFGVVWYLRLEDPAGQHASLAVRTLFPNDYNKIIREVEAIGAGDPVTLGEMVHPVRCGLLR